MKLEFKKKEREKEKRTKKTADQELESLNAVSWE